METTFNAIVCCMFSAMPLIFFILLGVISFFTKRKPFTYDQKNRSYGERQSVYWKQDNISLIGILFVILLIVLAFLLQLNAIFVYYIGYAIKKVEVVNDIVVNLTAITFAVAAGLVLLRKKYYLVFSIYNILEEYNFFFWLAGVIISCFSTCCLTMTLLDGQLTTMFDVVRFMFFELSVLLNLFCNAIVFYVAFKVMFSSDMRDLKLLDKLYRIHGIENLDFSQMEAKGKWKNKAVKINLEYLLEKYTKNCENINIENIKRIDFISTTEIERQKWYKKAKRVYIIFTSCLFLFGIFMSVSYFKEMKCGLLIIQTVFFIMDIALPFVPLESIQTVIFNIFWDTHGFCIREKSGNQKIKERFVANISYQLCSRNYVRYMRSFNSLTAFIKVALEKKVPKKNIEEIIENYINKCYKQTQNVIEFLPYFVIGYLMFEKNKEMKSIKKLYEELQLDKSQVFDFQVMLCSHIYYLERVHKIEYLEGNKCNYIKWLCYNYYE